MEQSKISSVLALLNMENTLSVNRLLAHSIGLEETIMYQALIKKYLYYRDRNLLDEDKWFYSTTADLEESTTFSQKKQKKLADRLCELCLIKKKKKGMPSKNYYCIETDENIIFKYLNKGEEKSKKLRECRIEKMNEDNTTYRKKGSEGSNNHRSAEMELQEAPKRNFKKRQNGTSRSAETELQEAPKRNFKKRQNGTTRSAKMEPKTKDNKLKDNKLNDNQSFIHIDEAISNEEQIKKENERMNEIRAEELIEYDYFLENYDDPYVLEVIEKIKEIVCKILCCEEDEIRFGYLIYNVYDFKRRINKLDEDIVQSIIEKIKNNKSKIVNPTAYIAKMLYEEPFQFAVGLLQS